MKATILAAVLVATTSTLSFAASDLASKAMRDHPGVTGTQSSFAPFTGLQAGGLGLAEKAMRDHPGVRSNGRTINPTSKPDTNSLSAKAMRDHPGAVN